MDVLSRSSRGSKSKMPFERRGANGCQPFHSFGERLTRAVRRTCALRRHDEDPAPCLLELDPSVGPTHGRVADDPRPLALAFLKIAEEGGREREPSASVEDDRGRLRVRLSRRQRRNIPSCKWSRERCQRVGMRSGGSSSSEKLQLFGKEAQDEPFKRGSSFSSVSIPIMIPLCIVRSLPAEQRDSSAPSEVLLKPRA